MALACNHLLLVRRIRSSKPSWVQFEAPRDLVFVFCFFLNLIKWSVVVYAFNSSIQETKAGGSLRIQRQPGLHSKYQATQRYMVGTYLKNIEISKTNKKKYVSHRQHSYPWCLPFGVSLSLLTIKFKGHIKLSLLGLNSAFIKCVTIRKH